MTVTAYPGRPVETADRPWLATLGWTTVLYALAAFLVGSAASFGGALTGGALDSRAVRMLADGDPRGLAVIAFGIGLLTAVVVRPSRRVGWVVACAGSLLAVGTLLAWRESDGSVRPLTIAVEAGPGGVVSLLLIVAGLGAAIGGVIVVATTAPRAMAPAILVGLLLGILLRPVAHPGRQTTFAFVAAASVLLAAVVAVRRPSTPIPPEQLNGGTATRETGRRRTIAMLLGVQIVGYAVDALIRHGYAGAPADPVALRLGLIANAVLAVALTVVLGAYGWRRTGRIAIRYLAVALGSAAALAVWIVTDPEPYARAALAGTVAATAAAAWLASSRRFSTLPWDGVGIAVAALGTILVVTCHVPEGPQPGPVATGMTLIIGGVVFAFVTVAVASTRSALPRLGGIEVVSGIVVLVWGVRLAVDTAELSQWGTETDTGLPVPSATYRESILIVLLIPAAVAIVTLGLAAVRRSTARRAPVSDSV